MIQITIDVMPEVNDWLTKRALAERCSVEEFVTIILNAVCINSQLNQTKHETEEIIQEA